jgi:hypothetical protein
MEDDICAWFSIWTCVRTYYYRKYCQSSCLIVCTLDIVIFGYQLNKYVWNHWLYCYRFFLQKNLFLKVICK